MVVSKYAGWERRAGGKVPNQDGVNTAGSFLGG